MTRRCVEERRAACIFKPSADFSRWKFLASNFQRLPAGARGRRRSLPSPRSVILRSQDKLMHQRLKGVALCQRWSRTEVQLDALIKTQTVRRQSQRLSGVGSCALHTAHQLAGTNFSLIARLELLQKPRPVSSCSHESHLTN